jgi:hypothetical protein
MKHRTDKSQQTRSLKKLLRTSQKTVQTMMQNINRKKGVLIHNRKISMNLSRTSQKIVQAMMQNISRMKSMMIPNRRSSMSCQTKIQPKRKI